MLRDAKLGKSFWAEALSTVVYIRNRSPTTALKDLTPYEALFNRKPSVKHLRIFGCLCFAHIPKDERSKLDPKSRKCVFLGYSSRSKGYRVYDLEKKKTIISRNLVFSENQRISSEGEKNTDEPVFFIPSGDSEEVRNGDESDADESDADVGDNSSSAESSDEEEINGDEGQQFRRSAREKKSPDRYGEWTSLCDEDSPEPSSYKEAIQSAKCDMWKSAMEVLEGG